MKLTELGAEFIRHLEDGRRQFIVAVDSRVEANGVRFRCPTCVAMDTAIAPHVVLLWDHSVSVKVTPGPLRWALQGSSLADLTIDEPIKLAACRASFRVTAGEVQPCS